LFHLSEVVKHLTMNTENKDEPLVTADGNESSDFFDSDEEDKEKSTNVLGKKRRARDSIEDVANLEKKKARVDEGDAYTEEKVEVTKEDMDFIDHDDDDEEIIKEYSKEQVFNDEIDHEFEEVEKQETVQSAFDIKFKQLSKKEKKVDLNDNDKENLCLDFLNDMEEAADLDIKCRLEKKPVVHKLRMLERTKRTIGNKMFQDFLLEHNLLKICEKWLIYPDRATYTATNIRIAILNLLTRLPVETHHIRQSCKDKEGNYLPNAGIGITLMDMWKNLAMPPNQRKVVKSLIEKWLRPIFEKSSSYSDENGARRRDPIIRDSGLNKKLRSQIKDVDFDAEEDDPDDAKYSRARRPKPLAMEFNIRPTFDPVERRSKTKKDTASNLSNMRRKIQAGKKRGTRRYLDPNPQKQG
jgi:transcription factor SPN1